MPSLPSTQRNFVIREVLGYLRRTWLQRCKVFFPRFFSKFSKLSTLTQFVQFANKGSSLQETELRSFRVKAVYSHVSRYSGFEGHEVETKCLQVTASAAPAHCSLVSDGRPCA
jgi:hypothetical protein